MLYTPRELRDVRGVVAGIWLVLVGGIGLVRWILSLCLLGVCIK